MDPECCSELIANYTNGHRKEISFFAASTALLVTEMPVLEFNVSLVICTASFEYWKFLIHYVNTKASILYLKNSQRYSTLPVNHNMFT